MTTSGEDLVNALRSASASAAVRLAHLWATPTLMVGEPWTVPAAVVEDARDRSASRLPGLLRPATNDRAARHARAAHAVLKDPLAVAEVCEDLGLRFESGPKARQGNGWPEPGDTFDMHPVHWHQGVPSSRDYGERTFRNRMTPTLVTLHEELEDVTSRVLLVITRVPVAARNQPGSWMVNGMEAPPAIGDHRGSVTHLLRWSIGLPAKAEDCASLLRLKPRPRGR